MTPDKAHILYVDDEEFNLTAFRATFRKSYEVHTALSAQEGEAILSEYPIELIITDQRMPGITGVEFLEKIIGSHPEPIRMVLTGFADIESIIAAINKGEVHRYITKPWEEDDIKMVIDSAIETFRLRAENRKLVEHLAMYNEELEATVALRTSELKHKSDELEISNRNVVGQNKQISKLNREKAEMLNLAGEDLQHPLKEILRTASHAIDRGSKLTSAEAVEQFGNIRSAATRIHAVLENLLLLNSIEVTGVTVFPTHVDPGMITQMVLMSHQPHALDKNIAITFERKGGIAMAHTDPTCLQTILDHLLSNAVKFSPPGKNVTVSVESSNGGARLCICDHGPGFTDEDKATLFTKFATHSAKPTSGELTTGLGLSIVKSYVDAVKGSIELETTPGAGATFVVTLPSMHR
ncbi:MAG: hybrid sensor histidine kinase/response regulator [Candidatus Kapabacteria bacterium]|nr:hybrid sensor histidine kinase/response regulator [Candidatus Kapabacteria bacterium]